MKSLQIAAPLVAAALALSACAGESIVTSSEPASELIATCGGVTFPTLPVDVNSFPPLDADGEAALDNLVNGPTGVEAGNFADADLAIANRSDDTLLLFGPTVPESDRWLTASFERRDGVWEPTSWGGCQIVISASGFGPAVTRLDPDVEPDPESTTLNIVINERDCASGEAPTDRDVVPVVIETATTVEIITMVEPVSGGANCPGNPWFPTTATLDAPLGDRVVIDGHIPPGQELSWPPDLDS